MSAIITTLRRRFRRPANPRGQGLILLYHRVADLPRDPQLMAVSPGRFREHLEMIRRHGQPMSLAAMTAAAAAGSLPPRAVAVTFDDGYSDNLRDARPLLEAFDVPATVFVTAGQVGSDREFWWDELERLLLEPVRPPGRLCLSVSGQVREWSLSEHESANPAADTWNVLSADPPSPRQRTYQEVCGLLRPLSAEHREVVLTSLREQTGMDAAGRPTNRAVTVEELTALGAGDLVEIGAHTLTHPVLSVLSDVEQEREVRLSKARLESMLNRPVTSFSYPFGTRYDYSAATVRAVRRAGFARACANEPGPVEVEADAFRLPRMLVRDVDGEAMERLLEQWSGVRAGSTV